MNDKIRVEFPPTDNSEWAYTVRVGFATDDHLWVAQVVDPDGEQLYAVNAQSLNEALGKAAVAIMEVEDVATDNEEES